MTILFFFLDAIVFFAIVVTVVSLATAAAVLLSDIRTPWFSLRLILPVLAFIASLIIASTLAYDVVRASIPSGRWLNLLLVALIAPVMTPIIWSAMNYTRRNLQDN